MAENEAKIKEILAAFQSGRKVTCKNTFLDPPIPTSSGKKDSVGPG